MFNGEEGIRKINSLIVAVVLMAAPLSGTLSNGFGIESGANSYVLIAIVLLLGFKLYKEFRLESGFKDEWTWRSFFILLEVVLLYIISKAAKGDDCNYTVIQLLFYAIIPIIVISFSLKTEYVLRYTVYLSVFTVFGLNGFLEVLWGGYNQADLGSVYSLVTVLVCTIFHARYYRSGANLLIKLIYIYNIYVLIRVLMVANRGAMLAILFAVFIAVLYRFDNDGRMVGANYKKIIILLITAIAVYIMVYNLESILTWLIDICRSVFGAAPSALSKMRTYIKMDDITNGRDVINKIVVQAIKESPIYGHGLRTFSVYTHYAHPYPHNYIYQYLFEGGIIFAIVPVFCSLWALIRTVLGTIKTKDEHIIAAMLVCQCFPKLLISSDVWMGTAIWMLVVYSANHLMGRRKNIFRFNK